MLIFFRIGFIERKGMKESSPYTSPTIPLDPATAKNFILTKSKEIRSFFISLLIPFTPSYPSFIPLLLFPSLFFWKKVFKLQDCKLKFLHLHLLLHLLLLLLLIFFFFFFFVKSTSNSSFSISFSYSLSFSLQRSSRHSLLPPIRPTLFFASVHRSPRNSH